MTYVFAITCSCTKKLSGIIGNSDKYDKLHCECGLVWKVMKPVKEGTK